MKMLEDRILKDGVVINSDILKVDSFFNHQMDVKLYEAMGREWKRLYDGTGVNKILTIEASGIGMACFTAMAFDCPAVFAKKSLSSNIGDDFYTAKVISFTKGLTYDVIVSKKVLGPSDNVLIIDDFLANGAALSGLIGICKKAGAHVVGCGIGIEKAFQPGGDAIRSMGYRVESLARIESMDSGNRIVFCENPRQNQHN